MPLNICLMQKLLGCAIKPIKVLKNVPQMPHFLYSQQIVSIIYWCRKNPKKIKKTSFFKTSLIKTCLGVLQREWCQQAGPWMYSVAQWDYLRFWSGF